MNVFSTGSMERGVKYSMGLSENAWRKITAVWETTPTLCRIIQDIDRFSKALDRIIESEGSFVVEYYGCHGHLRVTQKAVS